MMTQKRNVSILGGNVFKNTLIYLKLKCYKPKKLFLLILNYFDCFTAMNKDCQLFTI